MRLEHAGWRILKAGGIIAVSILLNNCGGGTSRYETNPQVYKLGDVVPEGGGVRKTGKPYKVKGRWYQPTTYAKKKQIGVASWYGEYFHGRKTANGEWYDMERLSAAHPTMPLPSYVRVTNLENRRTIVVRVNDRGPYASNRVIDMSQAAASELGFVRQGTARVSVEYIGEAPLEGDVRDMQVVDGGPNSQRRWSATQPRRGKPRSTASIPEKKPARSESTPAGGLKSSPLADELLISSPLLESAPTPAIRPVPVATVARPSHYAVDRFPAQQRTETSASVTAKPITVSSSFFVQAASFSKLQRAKSLSEDLADLGISDILPVEIGTDTFYRVRLGPFEDKKNAQAARDAVVARGHNDARIFAR
ncbi:MAG: septal ring lytic transglycosylase RlpA family protein [Halocynthiibacter sp.]